MQVKFFSDLAITNFNDAAMNGIENAVNAWLAENASVTINHITSTFSDGGKYSLIVGIFYTPAG